MTRSHFRVPRRAALLLLAGAAALAQGAESDEATRGFTFTERFQSSINTLGSVNDLDSNIGYNFNSHVSVDGGLPVYFVRPSNSTTSTTSTSSSNGIGNVYGQARVTFANPLVNFESTLTGTAPTGDQATGFSTGRLEQLLRPQLFAPDSIRQLGDRQFRVGHDVFHPAVHHLWHCDSRGRRRALPAGSHVHYRRLRV